MPVVASTTGSPGGAGTAIDPYDIATGILNLPGGDALLLRGGDYNGIRGTNDSLDTFKNLASGIGPDDYTVVMPYEGEPVTLRAHLDVGILLLTPPNFTRIRFQDLTFVGNATAGVSQVFCSGPGVPYHGSHLDIIGCVIDGFQGLAIQTASNTDGRLLNSTIRNLSNGGGKKGYVIYVNGGAHRWEVGYCTMENIDAFGIHHYSSYGEANDCRYHDNELSNWGMNNGGSGILVANGSGNWVWNNIVRDGGPNAYNGYQAEYAQDVGTDTRNSIWAHNIAYNHGGYGFSFTQNGTGNLLLNNIALGAALGGIQDLEGTTKTTNIFSGVSPAAIWVDPITTKNFHLLAGATAARGQGTYNANFPTGKDGAARAPGATDIGPHQYASATVARRNKDSRIYAIGWF